jgi:transcriptional regulator with XRE-family HTH domain
MGMKAVGSYLKNLRKQKGLSQKYIADYLNVSEKQVLRWEKGLSDPASSMLIHFSKIVDGSLEDISELLLSTDDNNDIGEELAEKRITLSQLQVPQSSERYLVQAIEHAMMLRGDRSRLEKLVDFGKKLVGM